MVSKTRATIEVHHFIFEVPEFGNLRPTPKILIWKKIKTATPDEKNHSLLIGTQTRIKQT